MASTWATAWQMNAAGERREVVHEHKCRMPYTFGAMMLRSRLSNNARHFSFREFRAQHHPRRWRATNCRSEHMQGFSCRCYRSWLLAQASQLATILRVTYKLVAEQIATASILPRSNIDAINFEVYSMACVKCTSVH